LHSNPRDAVLLAQEKEGKIKYLEVLKSSLTLLKQQSKQQWINFGDKASRLFFSKVKQRKLPNYGYAIKDGNGNRRERFDEVAKVMAHYYYGLLRKNLTQREEINWEVMRSGPQLIIKQQMRLTEPFIETGIREAILAIPSIKSPGPDGFSSSFFKASWQEVGNMICEATQEFFTTWRMCKQWKSTRLILIPKVQSPSAPTEFRPISCCNVVYKVS